MRYDMILVGLTYTIALMSLLVAIYIFVRLRKTRGVWQIGLLFTMQFVYGIGYALELSSLDDISTKMLFNHIQYMAIPFFAVTWMYVARRFADSNYRATIKQYFPFLIVPVIVFVSAQLSYFTNIDWYYTHEYLDVWTLGTSSMTVLTLGKGPLYYIHTTHSTLLTAYVVVLYTKTFLQSRGIHKRQALGLLIPSALALGTSVISYFSSESSGVDLTFYLIAFMSVIIIYALFKYEMLDLKPSAYLATFTNAADPMMILDDKYELISWNRAVEMQSKNPKRFYYHAKLEEFLNDSELTQAVKDNLVYSFKANDRHYVMEPFVLENKRGRKSGYLLKFNEMTSYMERIEKLDYQASHDELTKILNRRAFVERSKRYLIELEKKPEQFALLMMDIDDFKSVNDTFGHPVGDFVLEELAGIIQPIVPDNCIFSRYGGEEFVLLIQNCNQESVELTAEKIRLAVMNHSFETESAKIRIQISIGLFHSRDKCHNDIYEYVKAADDALYVSKRSGKNKVTISSKIIGGN